MEHQILLQGISANQLSELILAEIDQRLKEISPINQDERKYLTRKDVTELLSISMPTLHDWCKKKILNPYRIGNRVFFKSDEIDLALRQINQ